MRILTGVVVGAFVYTGAMFGSSVGAEQEVTFDEARNSEITIGSDQYGLVVEEMERAIYLKEVDQHYGDNLSPIELLGKYAETQQERERYAKIHVAFMADQVRRSQAWSLAVVKVTQDVDFAAEIIANTPGVKNNLDRVGFGGVKVRDLSREHYLKNKNSGYKEVQSKALFVTLDCLEPCDKAMEQLGFELGLGHTHKADIVFIGSDGSDSDRIFDWARKNKISKTDLERGVISLHADSDYWSEFRKGMDDVPRLIRQ